MLAYEDTRGLDPSRPAFSDVILAGIAPGGGLYVPTRLPALAAGWLDQWTAKTYPERALALLELFEVDLPSDVLGRAVATAYGDNFDDPKIAPVREVAPGRHVLELWHGPTCAFKDMALQLKPILFSEAVRKKRAEGIDTGDFLVLVATSGDTGSAALDGYANRDFVSIIVFYPKDGVSDLQARQMLTEEGANVAVFGIRGDFDDAQAAVKAAFVDTALAARLGQRGLHLTSANSINWGRVLPQIVYYASGYADMVAAGAIAAGDAIDVAVPTGNFGNILAGYYARRMGVPIRRLLCASNVNNVLADFLATGIYDITARRLVQTPSPSMDILVSSNLERLLYAAAGDAAGDAADDVAGTHAAASRGDASAAPPGAAADRPAADSAAAKVRQWMQQLGETRRFEVDRDTLSVIREVFVGDYVTDEENLATIREVYQKRGYLLDPHTAVAWRVADRLASSAPVLVVGTAHWAKFGADVYRALSEMAPGEPLPAWLGEHGATGPLRAALDIAVGQSVPLPLAALDQKPLRFGDVIDRDPQSVEAAIERAVAAF